MVMAKKPENEFEKAPAGVHCARCIRLIDLGTQLNERFQTHQHKVRVYWELPETKMTKGESTGKPFIVTKLYTLSLSDKSHLRNDLKSWRGRDFTESELAGFDLNNIVDKCCMLNVVHENDFANVAAIMPVPSSVAVPNRVNDIVVFDLAHFDQSVFDSLTDNVKATIMQSLEYQDMGNAENNEQQTQSNEQPFNDDIPF